MRTCVNKIRYVGLLMFFLISSLVCMAFPLRSFPPLLLSPSENAFCMMFDHRGVLWIGTDNGLKSYDGYQVRTYRSDAYSPHLLPNNTVRSLAEDKDNRLWVGTRNGLLRLDLRTGAVTTFHLPGEDQRIIYSLYVDPQGQLWVGTDGGLSVFDRKTQRFYTYTNKNSWLVTPEGKRMRMTYYSVKSMVQAPNGDLIIGTWSSDLLRLRRGTHTFLRYPAFNAIHSAYSLCYDHRGRLWVGSWGSGVARVDNPDNVRHPIVKTYPFTTGNFDIFLSIVDDPVSHNLWAATREGICTLNTNDDMAQWQQITNIDGTSLNYSNSIATDLSGNIWVLTQNNGVIQTTFDRSPFLCYNLDMGQQSFPVNFVSSLYTPDGNTFWLGLNPYGIARFDRQTGTTLFNHDIPGFSNIPAGALSTSFSSIVRRSNGDLWFADNNYGIIVKKAQGDAKVLDMSNTPWMKENFVNTIFESRKHILWIGQRSALSMVLPDGRGFPVTLRQGNRDISNCDIRGISEDRQGNIWLATDNEGIICVVKPDSRHARMTVRQYSPRLGNFAVDDATNCLQDRAGRLWAISNSGGLFLYNAADNRFEAKNRDYHFTGDRILAIAQDSKGDLWLTSDRGLIRLCLDKDNKPTDVNYYTREDGLGDLLFSENSIATFGREIYLGSRQGFIAFDPSTMAKKQTKNYRLIITDIIINDESWRQMTDSTLRQRISEESPSFTRRVTLPTSVKKISFDFALLSYGNARKNIYSYMLQGYDDDWKYCAGGSHSATYQNLPSGTYHLRIRAAGSNGQWQEMDYRVTVRVLPPWYASWWAYLIYIVLLFAATFATIRWYREHLRTQNRLRMGVVLTNITHELLTPLTVIYATIYKLRSQAPQYEDEYQVIDNNIQRTKRLLTQILEVRKSQAGQLRLKVSRGDLAAFVSNVVEEIRPMAEQKHIGLETSLPEKEKAAWFDSDKLDKILYNLLSNAIKYNRNDGHILLSLDIKEQEAVISVKDNGIGMDKKQLNHLYTRFFDGDYRRQNTGGTGIGLALVHELVTLHHGSIRCKSSRGVGTTFTVTIPINKKAYPQQEIDTSVISKAVDNETMRSLTDDSTPTPGIKQERVVVKANVPTMLIVEDNADLLELMKQALSKHYRVVTAKNGKQAWNVIQKEPLDIVVSDVMMPIMDGIELTRLIKNDQSFWQLPVILLTAKDRQEDENEGYAIGADAYITKPFSFEELTLRADMLIANRQKVWDNARQEARLRQTEEKAISASDPDKAFMMRATQIVMEHLDDTAFDRETFAKEMLVSSSTLYNKVHAITGKTVVEFVNSIRLEEAAKILRAEPTITIVDLAARVGFNTPKYFSRCFRKQFGVLPKGYQ
jgi:signal transduction histidine kinase/ligand-binding sensor domain-containing protein/DNA-binding response OmpR family regulator